jgi:histidine triad (HIT) family protein
VAPGGDTAPGCKFCAIVAGTLDAEIVYTDDDVVAFLDHRPLFPGHTLVVTRAHIETLRDLPADALGPFFTVVQRLAVAVQDGMQAQGTFVAENNVVSQSVPHLHVHVVPRSPKDGLRGFFWPRQKYADANAVRAAGEAVRAALA